MLQEAERKCYNFDFKKIDARRIQRRVVFVLAGFDLRE